MTTTTNRGYSTPATGANPGTWGSVDVNPNFVLIDNNLGGVSSVSLTNANVTLSSAQYQCGTIVLSGALTANVLVLFPNVSGWWTVQNNWTGSFYVAARLAAGGNQIGLPPGEAWDILADGTNMKYRNLPHVIGEYWDDSGSAIPLWVSACTVPPYLLADGSTFSQVTYPFLYDKLGTTTLPDSRGRFRAQLDGGTNRITTAASGIDGSTRFASGGSQLSTITQSNIPSYNLTASGLTVSGSITPNIVGAGSGPFTVAKSTTAMTGGANNGAIIVDSSPSATFSLTAAGSIPSGGSGSGFATMPPTYIGGITMIRAGG